ncbi:MAG: T9SS C-terminal target domain-containing protein [Calditrichaeota bacterium]|nr:T9SS type A sorting domain-containing protein [Calditrichota bacterium]RQW01017.1 MAG: T9SS C-terminal target domain-containing protein [Calditrichota bacterium]
MHLIFVNIVVNKLFSIAGGRIESTLLSSFLMLCVSLVYSQTYYLKVNLKVGGSVTYEISEIRKIDFSDITGIEDARKVSQVIQSFRLMQNYPNPFNPSTTIQYEIPRAGEVEIRIFDINGRLVKTIKNQKQVAGSYNFLWDGQNDSGNKVASGLYIYSLKFENTITSKKMILVK